MVPVTSMICMAVVALLTAALAVGPAIWLKKKGGRLSTFLFGCVIFLVFAMGLEQAGHQLILLGRAGPVIQGNLWLYALYAGLMAGVFEETGRLVAFRFLLKDRRKPVDALMYGAGHGGCEAVAIVGLAMVNDLIVSHWINTGTAEAYLGEAAQSVAAALIQTPGWMYLLGGAERIFALMLQVSLSVLVFAAVRRGQYRWFWLALAVHAAADAAMVAAAAWLPTLAVEGLILAFALGAALAARWVYRGLPAGEEEK